MRLGDPAGWQRAGRVLMSPRFLAGLLATVFASGGVAVFATYGPPGAASPAEVASGPDGPVHAAGRIVQAWLEGDPPTTHLRLAGAPGMDVVLQGNELASFGAPDFVEVTGEKSGAALAVYSIRPARDPVASSIPYLAVSAALGGALVTFEALRVRPDGRSWLSRLIAGIPRGMIQEEQTDESTAQRPADNHSGAPAPKS